MVWRGNTAKETIMTDCLATVHPDCRAFVAVVEELLARRRQEVDRGMRHQQDWQRDLWGPREWSRTELHDMVYPNYRNMRRGRAVRPPQRNVVMDIADYLHCTLEERNRLLVAADVPPVLPYLSGEDLQCAVQVAMATAAYLPLPAYVINRDWQIHCLNDHILTLVGISRAVVEDIDPQRLSVLDVIFDPCLPVYEHLQINLENWEYVARQNIYGFKRENLLCRFDDWYVRQVERWMALPRFREFWNEIEIDSPLHEVHRNATPSPYHTIEIRATHDQIVRLRSLHISLGNYDYPQVLAYQPLDPASQRVFGDLGIPTPEHGWLGQSR